MASETPFKVIIAGGGPIGLTAALALHKAGIEFVLLERRSSLVFEAGCDIILMPHGMRVLSQLGLWDDICRIGTPLSEVDRTDHKGWSIGRSQVMMHMGLNHGYRPSAVSRRLLTKAQFEKLPEDIREKCCFAGKHVSRVDTTASGVEVTCADGTSYTGSILIGADGAHSVTRTKLRELAIRDGAPDVDDEKPFLTTFRGMWIRLPTSATGLQGGSSTESHGQRATTQMFVGRETTVVGFYERLPEPTRERARYGPEDMEAAVERWGHIRLSPTLNLRGAWAARLNGDMVNLEEGVVRNWHHGGRVVLVGDAAHKYTPSTGQGCNVGLVDVVVLVNELHRVLESAKKEERQPSAEELTAAFATYQRRRYKQVAGGCERSGKVTENATWSTTLLWLQDLFLLSSLMFQKRLCDGFADVLAKTPVLDFVEFEDPVQGKVPWVTQATKL